MSKKLDVRGSIKTVLDVLRKAKSVLLTSHIRPEGDSIGSQLAMASFLKHIGKKVWIVNEDPVPFNYRFLPYWRTIKNKLPQDANFDTLLVVDSSNLFRIGNVESYITGNIRVVNIDHHISNDNFGIYWINPCASSTGEMIWELLKTVKFPITIKEVKYLYTAIITDTGGLRFVNTTERSFTTVAEMLKCGLKQDEVLSFIYEKNPFSKIKLLGLSLSTLSSTQDGKIVWFWVTQEMLKKSGACLEETEDFINQARSINSAKVAIFFGEETDGKTKISFRSKGRINVNKIAQKFGGGGHNAASGCTVKGNPQQVQEKVIEYVKNMVK